MLKQLLAGCLLFMAFIRPAAAQPFPAHPAEDSIHAVIDVMQDENKAVLKAGLRPLRQIAGAPNAFYTYFWEFGDGSFSFSSQPEHRYRDTGTYDIRFYATNNYDDGKAPKGKPRRIKVKKTMYAAADGPSNFFPTSDMLAMKINRMPRPGEEMITIVGYRHPGGVSNVSGSLLLFYNEKQFAKKSFALSDERMYNGERKCGMDSVLAFIQKEEGYLPLAGPSTTAVADPVRKHTLTAMLGEKKALFREQHAWRVENLHPGEEKFLFLSLETTPEMIRDTNAVVTISGMFIPDDPALPVAQYNLDMQIVASHDPNRMQLKNRRMNYRLVSKKKELTYKVQFQNTGKGPASKVVIGVGVPRSLNGQTLEILDYSPKCALCEGAYTGQSCLSKRYLGVGDSIFFVFNNIYLKGVQQEGVEDPDSTKGFIKYRVRFGKGMKKLPFKSQAAIIFDKNEPVITNHSSGRFKPGLSPGLILGYGKGLGGDGVPLGSIGLSISAFSPYRPYFQPEIYFNVHERNNSLVFFSREQLRDTTVNGAKYLVKSRALYNEVNRMSMDIVPLHLRYNVKNWLGVGAGMMMSVVAADKQQERKVITVSPSPDNGTTQDFEHLAAVVKKSFSDTDVALFADINIGKVRAGPALGIRFLQYLKDSQQRLSLYGIWRF